MGANAVVSRGVKDFATAVHNLPEELARQLAPVIAQQAQVLADEIRKGLAGHHKTGHLGQSVRVADGGKLTRKLVLAGGALTTKPVRQGKSGTYDYAQAEEYGTHREPAKPYFWPAVRRNEKAIRAAIAQALAGALATETVKGV